jgi:CBS domain-containing protein
MSPRAAWRLESLGFREVYDYAAGKADWLAWGLPREGESAGIPTVGDLARRDVPTSGLAEKIGAVRERTRGAGWEECVVTNDRRIILGLLRGRDLDADPAATAEEVMRPGPTTYKPDTAAAEAGRRMRERGVRALLVATPDGALVGLLRREDAERTREDAS